MSQIDTKLVEDIFRPQIKFEGVDEINKFARYFCDLYRIELFKDGLDLILTKLREKDLTFEVHLIKGWDTSLGCYLTEQSSVFNKVAGVFSSSVKKKIIIKSFSHNVIAHEMAHALEFESGLDLGGTFRKAIGLDMKGRQAEQLPLRGEIKRLMVDALKAYPQSQFLSELFARYYELLSICRNVQGKGAFDTKEVMDFYVNTTKYVNEIFNAKIKPKIDLTIAKETTKIADQVKIVKAQAKFQDQAGSFFKTAAKGSSNAWSKNVKSNSMYQDAWKIEEQRRKELEDSKKD